MLFTVCFAVTRANSLLDRAGYSRDLCALAEVEIGVMKDFKDIIEK